jgi:CubicO group peptidase (beta-lactamase class C family)
MKTRASGLCPKRLKNIDAYLSRITEQGKLAGAGALIIRHGIKAYHSSFGFQDLEKNIPMKNDSLYRIYSMTKVYTVVAAMTLYEKGLFALHEPIADFLPAFTKMTVAEHDERGIVNLVPANKPITFGHLFTMTSGIPYPNDESYSSRMIAGMEKQALKDAMEGSPWNTAKMVDAIAKAPLCFHPGEHWLYGYSHDVLGRLIEVISGKTLGEYFKEIFFDPLGLSDTAFYVPAEKQARAAKAYSPGPGGLSRLNGFGIDPVLGIDPAASVPPVFERGGAGLVSTMADCAKFELALLHNGKAEGGRILSRKTVDLIRACHILPSETASSVFPSLLGYGWGLGVRTMVDTAKAGLNGSVGEWAWGGMLGTFFMIDPEEDLVALYFSQILSDYNNDLKLGFIQTVYGAIDD